MLRALLNVGIAVFDPGLSGGERSPVEVFPELRESESRYLAFLRDHYFDDPAIGAWDRRAFAWAAYNAGPRAIARARNRAEAMGLDRNAWFGETELAVSRTIGSEPVRYVGNIQKYFLAYQLARQEEAARAIRIQDAGAEP